MKKRLFITSALMTAVMAASLATGTYAWYAAGGTGGIKSTEAKGVIATVDPTITTEGVEVTATLAEVTPNSKLCLAELVGGAYKTYYLNSNNVEVEYTRTDSVASKAYEVKVTITNMDNVSTLLGQTITISVTADDAGAEGAKRTKVWVSDSKNALADDAVYVEKTSVEYTFPTVSAEVNKTTVVAYVAVYVDGNNVSGSTNVADTGNISGNFTVSIANKAKS